MVNLASIQSDYIFVLNSTSSQIMTSNFETLKVLESKVKSEKYPSVDYDL